MKRSIAWRLALALLISMALNAEAAQADDATFAIGEGKYELPVPAGWQRKEPRTRIVEHEFAISAAEGDQAEGRVTVMAAGGSVEDNINRWIGQFSQPDGSETSEKAKVDQSTIGDAKVHLVDISGTFDDRPPFAGGKGIMRENYRMLGAIIATPAAGNYFIKVVGPDKTVADQREAFKKMIEGLKAK